MNQILIIFESKYGTTKRYAEWIATALSGTLLERRAVHSKDLEAADTIIYGGGLYAGGVSGIKFLFKNQALLAKKNLILFTCGLASPDIPENVANIRKTLTQTIPADMLTQMTIFHFHGGIDYTRLNLVHKSMMSMLHKMLLKKADADLTVEDRLMLKTYGKTLDFTKQESIQPLVDYVRSL